MYIYIGIRKLYHKNVCLVKDEPWGKRDVISRRYGYQLSCSYLDNIETRAVLSSTTDADADEIVSIFLQGHSARYRRYPSVQINKWHIWFSCLWTFGIKCNGWNEFIVLVNILKMNQLLTANMDFLFLLSSDMLL